MINEIKRQLQDHRALIELLEQDLAPAIAEMGSMISAALTKGNKLLVLGNGGSAADSQHFVAEIVGRFKMERKALPAVALSTDTSILTAIGNDYGYERLFARQVKANGVKGDVFIGISTSGNSANIPAALEACREKDIVTVGMTGDAGGRMVELCDFCIKVPARETPRIQESHILIRHILCSIVEEALFGEGFQ